MLTPQEWEELRAARAKYLQRRSDPDFSELILQYAQRFGLTTASHWQECGDVTVWNRTIDILDELNPNWRGEIVRAKTLDEVMAA